MHNSTLAVFCLSLTGLSTAASNTNTTIRFYSDETGCVNHYFGCSGLPLGYCCASSSPYCRWVQCVDCHAQNITHYQLLAHTNGNCTGEPSFSCAATSIDSCCKVDSPAGLEPANTCSARVVANGIAEMEPDLGECLDTKEPNVFGMIYENGTVREFKLPHKMDHSALISAMKHDINELMAHLDDS